MPFTPPTLYPSGSQIQTAYKNWAGSPPHLFGKFVGRPWQPWAFDEVYTETGLVIVREDIYENTFGTPISLKTHEAGQKVAAFTLSQLASQSIYATGTPYNAVMNGLMAGVAGHSDFVLGDRIFYTTWRIRALNRYRSSGELQGTVFAGTGVSASGLSLTTTSGAITTVLAGPVYVLNVETNLNIPGAIFADKNFAVEVGFGSVADALSSATTLEATASWPAYTEVINATDV